MEDPRKYLWIMFLAAACSSSPNYTKVGYGESCTAHCAPRACRESRFLGGRTPKDYTAGQHDESGPISPRGMTVVQVKWSQETCGESTGVWGCRCEGEAS